MKRKKKTICALSAGAFSLIGCITFAQSQLPEAISETAEVVVGSIEVDTVAVEEISAAERLSAEAGESYKTLRHMQYEGDTEDNLYPVALTACGQAIAAMRSEGVDMPIIDRSRGILTDLSQMVARAAVYYSNNGDSRNMGLAARTYVDIMTMPELSASNLRKDPQLYPLLAYVAASGTYNDGDYHRALDYFEAYMLTGDTRYRENVAAFMGQTALAVGQPDRAVTFVEAAAKEYPTNSKLLSLGIQLSQACGSGESMQEMLDRALLLNPEDEDLLKVQARLCEDRFEFKKALDIWHILADKHPNSLTYNEHLAQSYYNLAVGYYNESIMSQDEKEAKKLRRQSKSYFESAIPKLEEILANLPTSEKYLKALGVAYGCLDLKDEFERINSRLEALGNKPVAANQMPGIITSGNSVASAQTAASSAASSATSAGSQSGDGVPSFDQFARKYIEDHFSAWARKGEFETVEEYERRVARDGGANAEYERLLGEASDEYLRQYARRMRITDMQLSQYDAANQTFMVTTSYGPAIIKVPVKNKEAEMFKANWDGVQIRNPRFMIKDDRVGLASITFRTPAGKTYTYDASESESYQTPRVTVDINSILEAQAREKGIESHQSPSGGQQTAYVGLKSDVDERIPLTSKVNDNTFVLIIANEDYQKAIPVASAYHDGDVFREYCVKTLGIPESRVLFYPNATLNGVYESLEILKNKVKGSGISPDIIFYYAGHGLPDDDTKSAYMVPVDANPALSKTWIPMKEVYKELTSIPSGGVIAFVDACFSGSARSANKDDMLNQTRGIALKPRELVPAGSDNLFVLTAASGNETALPYKEKNHGLFTYFLLKKLQESKGNATLSEISRYVTDNVKSVSYSNYQKGQTPTVMTNGRMATEWENKKLR